MGAKLLVPSYQGTWNNDYQQYTWGYNFPIETNPEKKSVSELRVIFQGLPQILAILGQCPITIISTLILDLGQLNLVEPSGPPKKWPTMTTELRRNSRFYVFLKSVFLAKFFFQKTPKVRWKTDTYLGTFFFTQLCPVVATTWLELRIKRFFGAQKIGFWSKNPFFCHRTPEIVDGPFVALGETVHLQPWVRFFDFSFPSYGQITKNTTGSVDSTSLSPWFCSCFQDIPKNVSSKRYKNIL